MATKKEWLLIMLAGITVLWVTMACLNPVFSFSKETQKHFLKDCANDCYSYQLNYGVDGNACWADCQQRFEEYKERVEK